MIKSSVLLLYSFLILLMGCQSSTQSTLNKKTIGDICYEVNSISKELLQQNDSNEIADLYYFKLTIYEVKNNNKIQELFNQINYNKLLFYANTRIKNDITLTIGELIKTPLQIHFENNNRVSNKLVFMIAFEKEITTNNSEVLLSFNDNIFNNGILNFRFNAI